MFVYSKNMINRSALSVLNHMCVFSCPFKGMFRNVDMCICMFVSTNKNEDVSKIL